MEKNISNRGSIQIDVHQTSSEPQLSQIDDKNTPKISPTPPLLFSKRFLIAIMLFLCYVNFQALRNNMNITIVEMISNKSSPHRKANASNFIDPEFDWDMKTVGVVNSVIAYGGLFAFVAGFLVYKLGGAVSCALCMVLSGITTVLQPAALEQNFYLFLACRFFTGLLEISCYVSAAEIKTRWFPKKERATLIAFSFNGTNVGVAVAYTFCGYLAYNWGWRMVFYVTGAISIISGVILKIIVPNLPSQDKWISKKELAYILAETDADDNDIIKTNEIDDKPPKKIGFVLKCMLTSAPVWALFLSQFFFTWIGTVLSACLPLYIRDVTQKNSDEIGYITTIPNAVYIFMFPIAGALIDYWKNHTKISMTRIHKILFSLAFFSTSIFLVATIIISKFIVSLAFFVLIQIFLSVVPLVLWIIVTNLAPRYTSYIASISAISYSLGNIVPQNLVGFVVMNHSTQEWNNMFLLTAGISTVNALIFIFCGSSEPQKWSL